MKFFFGVSLLTILLSLNDYVSAKYLLVKSQDTKLGAIEQKNRTKLTQHGVFRAGGGKGPADQKTIFLGGSCAGRHWRPDVIKALDAAKIESFNPRLPEWTPEAMVVEDKHKEKDLFHVYVITNEAYGLISIFEIYQVGKKGKHAYVYLADEKTEAPKWTDNTPDKEITKAVFKLRKYIRDAITKEKMPNVKFFDGTDGEKKLTETLIADWKKQFK